MPLFEPYRQSVANPGLQDRVTILIAGRYLYAGSFLAGAYGASGLEFRLADYTSPDVAQAEQKLGALYGILPVQAAPAYRVGEWANARLICRKGICEHWINGKRVLAY